MKNEHFIRFGWPALLRLLSAHPRSHSGGGVCELDCCLLTLSVHTNRHEGTHRHGQTNTIDGQDCTHTHIVVRGGGAVEHGAENIPKCVCLNEAMPEIDRASELLGEAN